MTLKHHNPTKPRHDGDGNRIWARAPYNFVPLPEQMVSAAEPLSHDKYHADGLTGRIECTLETCSPVYVRGMLLEADFRAQRQKLLQRNKNEDDESAELTPSEKLLNAPFFATTEEEVEGQLKPVIPGSTLRGMVRSLVEIIAHGRMRWVADQRDPYQQALGKYGRDIRAGYLVKRGDDWFVQPAILPSSIGLPERGAYLKVKERVIRNVPGYIRFNNQNYRPQVHPVSFNVEVRRGKQGQYAAIDAIGSSNSGYKYQGTLVCSGNMLETGKIGQTSPRKNHALVLERDKNAPLLRIRPQSVKDYLAGLTPFQQEALQDWSGGDVGCLANGKPVFYVAKGNEVIYFGHSPNFRVPAQLRGQNRASTPRDFVPAKLQQKPEPDLADAIFGWIEEEGTGLKGHRAGRVSFENAHFQKASDGVWYATDGIVPHVLATPKPTTFQHYLVQDAEAGPNGHHPDYKETLAHYGTSPKETQIRGYKLYWHKGDDPDIEANKEEKEHESQLTRIRPLKPGVRFTFNIHFENLRAEELGALLWALTLPGDSKNVYRHKLGMGKPLGMGAVAIQPRLFLSQRVATGKDEQPSRYERLFADEGWYEATNEADTAIYVSQFEQFMLKNGQLDSEDGSLASVERIKMLLAMLEWREGTPEWLDKTRYMEIEHGDERVNEYKERPVLPDPLAVIGEAVNLPRLKPRASSPPRPINRHQPENRRPTKAPQPVQRRQEEALPEIREEVSETAIAATEVMRKRAEERAAEEARRKEYRSQKKKKKKR